MIHLCIQIVLHFIHHQVMFSITIGDLNPETCTVVLAWHCIESMAALVLLFGINWDLTPELDSLVNGSWHAFIIDEHCIHVQVNFAVFLD